MFDHLAGLTLAAVMLYAYRLLIIKRTVTLIGIIPACTALLYSAVQEFYPGPTGIALSLILAAGAAILLTKGAER